MSDKITVAEAAAVLRSLIPKEKKLCARCGVEFDGRPNQKYCSRQCAKAVYWDRNRAELNRKRMEKYYRQKDSGGD